MDLTVNNLYLMLFYNGVLIFKNFCLYKVLYFDLNRTINSVVQEIDFDVDLTAVFSLKKISTCSQGLSQLNTFKNINITEALKHFQYGEFKTRLNFIQSNSFKFI